MKINSFAEVVNALHEHKHCSREGWKGYIVKVDAMDNLYPFKRAPYIAYVCDDYTTHWTPFHEDILANDWIIHE